MTDDAQLPGGSRLETGDLSVGFEQLRSQLFQVAYGILGSVAEAEDVVQDAWLRLQRADRAKIENLSSWLKTVVARLSLDTLDRAWRKRESYVGEWLPEPLVAGLDDENPEDRVTLDETVAAALSVVLERLTPAERTSFLLHDTFGMPFAEIAELVGRSPASVRQLAARARREVAAAKPRFSVSREEQEHIVLAFAAACASGDLEQLISLLDPAVIFRSDGGGHVPSARAPIHGAERVGRTLVGLTRRLLREARDPRWKLTTVNGGPGIVAHDGVTLTVMSFVFDDRRIVAIDTVRNPEKLTHIALPPPTPGGDARAERDARGRSWRR
jgi:RNA polymerase sigma-70 factor, ECF subfamily